MRAAPPSLNEEVEAENLAMELKMTLELIFFTFWSFSKTWFINRHLEKLITGMIFFVCVDGC